MTTSRWHPRSSSAAIVRMAYSAPLAPVIANAKVLTPSGGTSPDIDRHGSRREIEDPDVAVQIERALHLREVVGADERLLVDEQDRDEADAREVERSEIGHEGERRETSDGRDVHET